MLAKTTNALIAALIAASATLAVAQAAPLQGPSQGEQVWMDRSSGPADGN